MSIDIDKLSDNERYEYLITSIEEKNEIWLLRANQGMYAIFEDKQEKQYIPVWPERKFALEFVNDSWEDYQPEAMSLKEFKTWLYELKEDKFLIAAFQGLNMKTIPIDPQDMIEHLG